MATITEPGTLHMISGMAMAIPMTGNMSIASSMTRFRLRLSLKLDDSLIFYKAPEYK